WRRRELSAGATTSTSIGPSSARARIASCRGVPSTVSLAMTSRRWGSRIVISSSLDAERDRADVALAAGPLRQLQQRVAAARLGVDVVSGVGGVGLAVGAVGRGAVDGVTGRVAEEHLAGVDDRAAHVDLEVDVRGAPAVPARVDRVEDDAAVRVAALVAAQEAPGVALHARVHA